MRSPIILYVSIVAAVSSLAVGFILAELPVVSVLVLVLGAGWILSEIRRWRWIGSLSLFLMIIGAAVGIIVEVSPIWAIMAAVLSLAAWEFGYFQRFIVISPWVRNEDLIKNRHQRRVIFVSVIGAVLAWVTTQIEIDIGFGVALLLAIISLMGLSRAVLYLRRSE